MNPWVVGAQILVRYRKELLGAVFAVGALLASLVGAVSGLVMTTPLASDDKMAVYRDVASAQSVAVTWEEMVALDAVRFGQDWDQMTRPEIEKTAALFASCVEHTGRLLCTSYSLPQVMEHLHLSKELRDQVEVMLSTLRNREGNDAPCRLTSPTSSRFGYIWPVDGPISSCFGLRKHPVFGEGQSMHWGVDVAAPEGTPIHAAQSGVVTLSKFSGAYGNLVVILGDDGMVTYYAHQWSFIVFRGDRVVAGQVIGYVGTTGMSTGPHLHFETRPAGGDPVNPFSYYD